MDRREKKKAKAGAWAWHGSGTPCLWDLGMWFFPMLPTCHQHATLPVGTVDGLFPSPPSHPCLPACLYFPLPSSIPPCLPWTCRTFYPPGNLYAYLCVLLILALWSGTCCHATHPFWDPGILCCLLLHAFFYSAMPTQPARPAPYCFLPPYFLPSDLPHPSTTRFCLALACLSLCWPFPALYVTCVACLLLLLYLWVPLCHYYPNISLIVFLPHTCVVPWFVITYSYPCVGGWGQTFPDLGWTTDSSALALVPGSVTIAPTLALRTPTSAFFYQVHTRVTPIPHTGFNITCLTILLPPPLFLPFCRPLQ